MDETSLRFAARAADQFVTRLKDDPLIQWQPHSKQIPLLESKKREAWLVAANRAGKSDAGAALGAALLRFGDMNPRGAYSSAGRLVVYDKAVSIWVASPTLNMSRDIMQAKMFDNGYVPPTQPHKPFIPWSEIEHWSEKNKILRLKNGSLCGYMAYEQGRERFQGTGKQLIILDEAPPKSIYTECVIRVEAGQETFIRGTLTLLPPEGMVGGISWIFSEKLSPWLRGKRPPDLDLFSASIYDNPHISRDTIRKLEELYPPGSLDRQIRLEGKWLPGMVGARAYMPFNREIHVNPHLGRDSVEWHSPLLFSFDANVEPLIANISQEIPHKFGGASIYRVIDEIYLATGTIDELGREFKRRYPCHGAEVVIYGDATARRRTAQTGRSDYELLVDAMSGLQYPISLCVPEVNPIIRNRINSVNFILRGHGGLVRCEVAPHCEQLIEDFEVVQRDKLQGIKKSKDKRDPYYYRTHASDGFGYMVHAREPVSAGNVGMQTYEEGIPMPDYDFS